MKSEDFERLKAVCEKEGFEIGFKYDESTYTVRLKKDIWEGVEFVDRNTTNFPICRFSRSSGNTVWYYNSEGQEVCWPKDQIKPSTESAYIEQLKAEAFKRFGEIKEWDRFIIGEGILLTSYNGFGFKYFKDQDLLCFNGYHLYHQGKWATRVHERVKIISADLSKESITFHYTGKPNKLITDIVSKLEEYLNK